MAYKAELESLRSHTCPEWFNNAKLGIFIHFGLYSVPAYAPKGFALGLDPSEEERFFHNPYAEWYQNGLRCGKGETFEHHKETYGEDFPYARFADMFAASEFNADTWASFFASLHARYVILTTKHHDGFCLYKTKTTEYNSVDKAAHRDFTKELADACRGHDVPFGVYYSGLLDWTHSFDVITDNDKMYHPDHDDEALAELSYHQAMELIDQYHPSVFWNDIKWASKGYDSMLEVLAHYYNTVPEGVIDYRFPYDLHDYYGREYLYGDVPEGSKWELTRGLGLSFGYNRYEDAANFISVHDLIALLIETVADNGNLLINTGPRADGTLDPIQMHILSEMGIWLDDRQEAIFDTEVLPNSKQITDEVKIYGTRNEHYEYYFAVSPTADTFTLPFSKPALVLGKDSVTMRAEGNKTMVKLLEPYKYPLVFRVERDRKD